MPKPSKREIDESYDREGLILDEEDEALLRHVLLEDALPQGLHRRGMKEVEYAQKDDYVRGFQRQYSQ